MTWKRTFFNEGAAQYDRVSLKRQQWDPQITVTHGANFAKPCATIFPIRFVWLREQDTKMLPTWNSCTGNKGEKFPETIPTLLDWTKFLK